MSPTNRARAVKQISGEPLPSGNEDKKDPSNSSAPPVGKTATRKKGRRVLDPVSASQSAWMQNGVALLRAEGMSQEKISKSLDLSRTTVSSMLQTPRVQERISELREIHRLVTQEKMADIAEKAWKLTDKTLNDEDPQGFMRMTAGLSNVEKISQGVSGEKQRVEVSGVPGEVNPKIEIKNLLVALFGPETKA